MAQTLYPPVSGRESSIQIWKQTIFFFKSNFSKRLKKAFKEMITGKKSQTYAQRAMGESLLIALYLGHKELAGRLCEKGAILMKFPVEYCLCLEQIEPIGLGCLVSVFGAEIIDRDLLGWAASNKSSKPLENLIGVIKGERQGYFEKIFCKKRFEISNDIFEMLVGRAIIGSSTQNFNFLLGNFKSFWASSLQKKDLLEKLRREAIWAGSKSHLRTLLIEAAVIEEGSFNDMLYHIVFWNQCDSILNILTTYAGMQTSN